MDSGNEHPAQNLNDMIGRLINDNEIERKEDLMLRTDESEKLANKFLDNAERFRLKPGGDLRAYRTHIAPLNDHFAMIQNTGGGKNDCLIISFLMGVSGAYRSAEEFGRNRIADFFRRTILPDMLRKSSDPNVLATLGGNTDALIGELDSTSYLSDIHINLLGHLFHVSILSLETGKVGRMGTTDMLEPPTLALLPATNNSFKKQYDRGIIICNRGNGHYETVMDTVRENVIFPLQNLANLFDFVREGIPFLSDRVEEGEHRGRLGGIEIKEGNFVKHDGQLFVVIDRKVNYPEKLTGPVTLKGAWLTPILNPPPKDWNEAFLLDSRGTSKLQDKVGTEYRERLGYQKLEEPGEPRRVKAVIFIGAGAIEKIPEGKIPNILDADMADRMTQGVDAKVPAFIYFKPTLRKRRNAEMEVYRSAVDGPAGAPGGRLAEPDQWQCPNCTLLNPMSAANCEACGTPRPAGSNVANTLAELRLVPPAAPAKPPIGATRRRLANALKAGRGINEDSPEGAYERERQLREGKLPANVKRYIEFTRELRRDRGRMTAEERNKLWKCEQCSLNNPKERSQCEACDRVRSVLPQPLTSPWRHENVYKLLDEEEGGATRLQPPVGPLPPVRAPGQPPPVGPLVGPPVRAPRPLPPVRAPGQPPPGQLRVALAPLVRPPPPAPEAPLSRLEQIKERVKELQERVAKLGRLSPIEQKKWDCRICTLENPANAKKCAVCEVNRQGGSRRKRKTARRKKRNIVDKSLHVRSFKRK